MVAIYRALGLDVSRTPKVGKKRLRLTYDKELTKTLKHLRYKGNTIIEKGATFAIKNKNTSKLGHYEIEGIVYLYCHHLVADKHRLGSELLHRRNTLDRT